MKRRVFTVSRRYQAALRMHLRQGGQASRASARELGHKAMAAGLQALDLAKLHEHTLLQDVLPGYPPAKRVALIKQAGMFLAEAITPIARANRSPRKTAAVLGQFIEAFSLRTVELAASNRALNLEITQREAMEQALKKRQIHYTQLLEKSERLQEQLRRLSRQVISAHEEERKEISRELHDIIAQSLTGINVRLAALKKEAQVNSKGLGRKIAGAQRLVEKSMGVVHQFARQLRPAALDDLGLIPALHSFTKSFATRTGVDTHLTAFGEIEQSETAKRTVLFRVAQEALCNVARHARATRADVILQKLPGGISMKVIDDGKSFNVDRFMRANTGDHLGLLGMKERVEMVGGAFRVESAPGKGTTVRVEIPAGAGGERRGEKIR